MEQDSTSKKFSYVAIGRIISISLQGIFYLLFAALLDPETYGELNVIIALAGTFSVISRFGLNHTLQVYRAKGNSDLSNQISTLFIITTSAAALILLYFDVLAAVLCVAMSFFVINIQNLLGLKQYKNFMLQSILKSSVIVIIPLLLYFVFEIQGIVLGMIISNFLASIPFLNNLKIKSIRGLKNYYKVIIHNFGVDANVALPVMVDKLLIAPLFGFFIVGIYQFNLQILLALSVLPGILYSFLLSEESSGKSHRKISYLVISGSIGVVIAVIFFAPIFVDEFFPRYTDGIFSLQILVVSLIPLSFTSIFNAKLMARESTKIGFSAIIRIASLLILITFLGDLYGLVGLSFAVLFSIILNTRFLFILYKKSERLMNIS